MPDIISHLIIFPEECVCVFLGNVDGLGPCMITIRINLNVKAVLDPNLRYFSGQKYRKSKFSEVNT